jgi:hypothetical protein
VFEEINRKFKKVFMGPVLQTRNFQYDKVIEFDLVSEGNRYVVEEDMKALLKEKMLHLSYTYSLWELCLCWKNKPRVYIHQNITEFEKIFSCIVNIAIYREVKRTVL